MSILITRSKDVIYPDELDFDFMGPKPEAVNEPQFVGFQCLGCGGRHAELFDLLDCQQRLMTFYVQQRTGELAHA